MTRTIALLFLLVLCSATAVQSQVQAPKPDPELKKLQVFVGHWTREGEQKPGPLGPGGKVTGEYDGQMILGGFFFQGRWRDKGAMGETQALEICGYDPTSKHFVQDYYGDHGTRLSGVVNVSESTWNWEGKGFIAGKQYPLKGQIVSAADSMSFTETFEISADGKTWTPIFEGKYTKVEPAPKK